jgi:hypothetical protein
MLIKRFIAGLRGARTAYRAAAAERQQSERKERADLARLLRTAIGAAFGSSRLWVLGAVLLGMLGLLAYLFAVLQPIFWGAVLLFVIAATAYQLRAK